MLLDGRDGVVHLLRRLAHGEASYGVAWQVQVSYALHVVYAYVVEHRALVDAEEHLSGVHGVGLGIVLRQRLFAALQPADRAVAALADVLIRRGDLDALVKGHGDVGAEVGLYPHALLRAHEDVAAVDVAVEAHAVLPYLAQLRKGEDLEPAAVREDGPVPGHELVQPAERLYELVPRADVEVVGV